MKTKILGTGLSGLVGSRVVELLGDNYEFDDLSFDTGVDITNKDKVNSKFQNSDASWVLHFAAKTDVDLCEKDKILGDQGSAWKINVGGTKNIVDAAYKTHKKVIYISTDFVFDGKKDIYYENDQPNPLNWYGVTKYEGEKIVLSNPKNIVIRISYPYRAKCTIKTDFVHTILNRLEKKQPILAVWDHLFTPTFIDDIAHAINKLMDNNGSGIFHVNGSTCLSPFQAAHEIARIFGYSTDHIIKSTVNKYYEKRAPRPLKLNMNNGKILEFGILMKKFTEGLNSIKQQGIS